VYIQKNKGIINSPHLVFNAFSVQSDHFWYTEYRKVPKDIQAK